MITFVFIEGFGLALSWHKTPLQDIGIIVGFLSIQIKF
jgi:hypothetical protein